MVLCPEGTLESSPGFQPWVTLAVRPDFRARHSGWSIPGLSAVDPFGHAHRALGIAGAKYLMIESDVCLYQDLSNFPEG
jgi:hypothetical protein